MSWDTFEDSVHRDLPPGFLVETSLRLGDVRREDWTVSVDSRCVRVRSRYSATQAHRRRSYCARRLNIAAVTWSGSLWHTTKFADGTWLPTWLGDFPSPDIRPISDVACASSSNGDFVVCALTKKGKGRLHYAIRSAGAGWSERWLDDFPAPDIRPIADQTDWEESVGYLVRPVACAVAPTGEL